MKRLLLAAFVTAVVGCGDSGADGNGGGGGSEPKGSIECGADACDECCLDGACASTDDCNTTADPVPVLFCDGPEDCGSGEACCAGLPAAAFPIRAECTAAAECSDLPSVQYFCHTDEDCGSFGTCAPWEYGDYVSVCGM